MSLPGALLGAGESPTDRVSKTILIDGTPLSNEINVIRFSVSKVYNKIATAKLFIEDGNVEERDFPQSNADLFKPGKEIEIQIGYDESTTTIFKGIIIRHALKIKNGSFLEIEAKDKAIKLAVDRKNKAFVGDNLDSDIFDTIIGSTLEKEIESTTVLHQQLVQYYVSDWDFIVTRAEANAQMVLTDDGKIIIKKPSLLNDSGLTFTYGGQNNIIEFEAEMDVRRQANTIKSTSWDYATQSAIEPIEGVFSFTETGNITSQELGEILAIEQVLSHSGNLSQSQLHGWADAYTLKKQLSKACGRLRVEGRPSIKPGQKITLEGVGDRFNGDVLVTGVLHQFSGNYLTDIQFGWAEKPFYNQENITEKSASGLIPGVTGLQIGIVQSIVEDPENGFRVQVKLPMISTTQDGIWARVASLDAGDKRGFFFRPEVNDEVILGFINDDPRDAIVLGMLHSRDLQPPFTPEQTNPKKGIVSKEGMKVYFDDIEKKTSIEVPIGSRDATTLKTITIDQSMIEMKDEFNNSIKMESSGITISSQGNITINGTMVFIN